LARRGIIGGVTRLLGGPGVAVAIAAAASAAPLASDEFVATATTLSADSGGTALGEVTPATPVTVAATRADAAQVAIEGWSMHDAPQYLYPAIGQRIVLVTLDAAGQAARTIERSQDDKYGIHWDEVKIVGWVPGANLTADLSTVWQAARTLYQDRCSACHALHRPTEFTANQWPSILKIMTMRAALAPNEAELVTKYLQMHAKVPGAGGGPGPKTGVTAGGRSPKR